MHGTHMARRKEITARPITRTVTVASPLNPGLTDKVEFVSSPLDRVRGKQRLLPEQVMAGEKYQNAWTMLQGPRAMQWESNVQSARGPRISPAIPLMQAGEVLASATSIIGKNVLIIEAVLGYGYTMEETASKLFERTANSDDARFIGRVFRESLTALALHWFPDKTKSRRVPLFYRSFNDLGTGSTEVEPSETAHASHRGVDYKRR